METPGLVDKIKTNLGRKLNWTPDVVNEFCRLLLENGMVIAGSFPLQAVLNQDWIDSDIDIWAPPAEKKGQGSLYNLASFLSRNGRFHRPYSISTFVKLNDYQRLRNEIEDVYVTRDRDVVVQIMLCRIPVMDVVSNFDLTICRVAFNGEAFRIPITTQRDIETRTLSTDGVRQTPVEWFRTVGRMVKYYQRGFFNINYRRINRDFLESQVYADLQNSYAPERMTNIFLRIIFVRTPENDTFRNMFFPRILPAIDEDQVGVVEFSSNEDRREVRRAYNKQTDQYVQGLRRRIEELQTKIREKTNAQEGAEVEEGGYDDSDSEESIDFNLGGLDLGGLDLGEHKRDDDRQGDARGGKRGRFGFSDLRRKPFFRFY